MSTSSSLTEITSSTHFRTLLSSNSYVVADFYADWCGPCKAIAPLYAQMAAAEAKPGRLAFAKVNVDRCQDVATEFGVSAMPTFLILKNGTVTQTIRGADPSSLRSAISAASRAAASGPAKPSAAFQGSSGRTLGGTSSSSTSSSAARQGTGASAGMPNMGNMALDASAQLKATAEMLVRGADSVGLGTPARFVGLYLWTLFSLDAAGAAEKSPFVAESVRNGARPGGVKVGRVGS